MLKYYNLINLIVKFQKKKILNIVELHSNRIVKQKKNMFTFLKYSAKSNRSKKLLFFLF